MEDLTFSIYSWRQGLITGEEKREPWKEGSEEKRLRRYEHHFCSQHFDILKKSEEKAESSMSCVH